MENETFRIDVISDTHGHLSPELLEELKGADLILHAGDVCSSDDLTTLERIATVKACLGNNDFAGSLGEGVGRIANFIWEGLRFQICHYEERLVIGSADVYICGHTHRPRVIEPYEGALLMNPGSPTYPRSIMGPTLGRIYIKDGQVQDASIIEL